MAATQRNGRATRARISDVATRMFIERGFDDVTVTEVAAAAGVSRMTVFTHFPRKEDLLLDRTPDAIDIIRRAIRGRGPDTDALTALHEAATDLVDRRHPLSGVRPEGVPLLRTIMGSPALITRTRELAAELRAELETELARDERFAGDPGLAAAVVVAAYGQVLVGTARHQLDGWSDERLVADHRRRLEAAFDLLDSGLSGLG